MMNDIPWFELTSVLGSILVVVAVYEFIAVRPLRGRLAKLSASADLLHESVHGVTGLSRRLVTTERVLKQELCQLGLRLGQAELRSNAHPYEQAINMAGRGQRAEHLMSCCGLAEVEANLISLLHGDRNLRSSVLEEARGR